MSVFWGFVCLLLGIYIEFDGGWMWNARHEGGDGQGVHTCTERVGPCLLDIYVALKKRGRTFLGVEGHGPNPQEEGRADQHLTHV